MKKRIFSVLLAVLMLCSLPMTVMAEGLASGLLIMPASAFTDVPADAWYAADVNTAVALGLVTGRSADTYAPGGNLKYSEAVKLAACMHQIYTQGSVTLEEGTPWYQTYVDYAKENGIITKEYAWNEAATRAGYMEIFAHALPEEALAAVNSVADGSIPDVSMEHPQAAAIYKLYRAGILEGSGDEHLCKPDASIRRSEVAAILVRMMDENSRREFTLGEQEATPSLAIDPSVLGNQSLFSLKLSDDSKFSTYEWHRVDESGDVVLENDDIYSDVKTPTLRINNDLRPADDAKYYCIVRDLSGNVRVTDKTKPGIIRTQSLRITQQPKDVAAKPGDFVNFIVTVTGGKAPYTYQWHKIRPDGGDIIPTGSAYYGLNEDTLQVKELSVGPDNNSKYYCVITDADGKTITSQTATLTIMMDPLAITQQPQALEILAGETAVFSVKVSGGSGSYDYRWNLSYDGHTYDLTDPAQYQRAKDEYKVFGGTFTGMNTDTLTYTNATADPWGYHVWCEITDRATGNTVESNFVSLDVYAPLAIAEPPHWVDAWITDNVSFTVTVTGGKAPYSYLWTSSMGHVKASSRMSNETSDTFEFILWGNEMDEEMFYCTVTDASGQSVKTNGARLDVHMGAY